MPPAIAAPAPAVGRTDAEPFERTEPVGTVGRFFLGVFLIALGAMLLYFLYAIWPAVIAATDDAAGTRTVSLFGGRVGLKPSPDAAIILLVVSASALGSYVHAATSFTDYVGNRRLARSWLWWYVLRVFIGSALALLFYFAVRGGFFGAESNATDVNAYGVAALAGLVGLFSKQATDKLREVFDTLFKTAPGYGDDARDDSVDNPLPVVAGVEPESVPIRITETLTLRGSGFMSSSTVSVAPGAGNAVVLEGATKFVSDNEIKVTLREADVAEAGELTFTVYNPPPGGGASEPVVVRVTEPLAPSGADGGGAET